MLCLNRSPSSDDTLSQASHWESWLLPLQDSASVFKGHTAAEYADSVVASEILVDLLSSCGKTSFGTYLLHSPVASPHLTFNPPRSNLNPSNWHFQFFSLSLDLVPRSLWELQIICNLVSGHVSWKGTEGLARQTFSHLSLQGLAAVAYLEFPCKGSARRFVSRESPKALMSQPGSSKNLTWKFCSPNSKGNFSAYNHSGKKERIIKTDS